MLISGEAAMLALGRRFGAGMNSGCVVYFHGDLGAGKTTLVRGILSGMGYQGSVKSPTYTLIEPYAVDGRQIHHLDLYRLADPEEVEYLGIRDYAQSSEILLIEWPEKGAGFLPAADIEIFIRHAGTGRELELVDRTPVGKKLIHNWLSGY